MQLQSSDEAAPSKSVCSPGGHDLQEVSDVEAMVLEYVSISHALQLEEPCDSLYEPPSQAAH